MFYRIEMCVVRDYPMTPLEKAQNCGFTRLRSYDAVEGVMKLKFMELGHVVTVDYLLSVGLQEKRQSY